jgi:SAM-dependent methyltransferase
MGYANIIGMFAPVYQRIFPLWTEYLRKEIGAKDTVLDLGCGYDSPLKNCSFLFATGVELFPPYFEESRTKAIHNEYINADIRKIDFAAKSFDVVLAAEVLEHLSKEEGYRLLGNMEKWARKKVILTTPNSYVAQDTYDNNEFQKHLSGWTVADLRQRGYKIYGMHGWKVLRGERITVKYRPYFLWSRISDISQLIVYHFPKQAYEIFAVKNVSEKV